MGLFSYLKIVTINCDDILWVWIGAISWLLFFCGYIESMFLKGGYNWWLFADYLCIIGR